VSRKRKKKRSGSGHGHRAECDCCGERARLNIRLRKVWRFGVSAEQADRYLSSDPFGWLGPDCITHLRLCARCHDLGRLLATNHKFWSAVCELKRIRRAEAA
jgi:hypothetical protein